jgi:hypothetical protein
MEYEPQKNAMANFDYVIDKH